jgi:hypothetical protein
MNGAVMGVGEQRNSAMVEACPAQGDHSGTPLHRLLDERVAATG